MRLPDFTKLLMMVGLFLIPRFALADVKISIKFNSGWANISGGDVNHGTKAFYDWGKIYFALPPEGLIEGGFTPIHQGYEIGGDLIFELSPKLGVGIGGGYLQMSRPFEPTIMRIYQNPQDPMPYCFSESTELSAIPIRLGLFLSLPLVGKIEIAAHSELSLCLKARYHADWYAYQYWSIGSGPSQHFSTTAEKKFFLLGLHGGLGFEYRLIQGIGLFIEGQGRYARIRGLKGTSISEAPEGGELLPSFSEIGKLYYESVPMLPNSPRLIMVQSDPPPGPDGEPRLAVVDFSGVSLQAGIRIRL